MKKISLTRTHQARKFSIVAACALATAVVLGAASTALAAPADFKTAAVSGGVEITEYVGPLGDDVDVSVPSSIDGKSVVAIGKNAFEDVQVRSVTLPSTVTAIKDGGFLNCHATSIDLSSSKVKSIYASMLEDEKFMDYLFPILRYHTRWSELTAEDFKYLFQRDKVTYEGYYMRVDVKAAENVPRPKRLGNYDFAEYPLSYMDKIRELCEKEGIDLILIKAPSLYPHWYDEWDAQVVEYAEKYDLPYYNFLETADEIGVDFSTDTYDGGLHMNLSGAEKLSDYFGKILVENHNVPDRRTEESYASVWEPKLLEYYEGIEERKRALEQ